MKSISEKPYLSSLLFTACSLFLCAQINNTEIRIAVGMLLISMYVFLFVILSRRAIFLSAMNQEESSMRMAGLGYAWCSGSIFLSVGFALVYLGIDQLFSNEGLAFIISFTVFLQLIFIFFIGKVR